VTTRVCEKNCRVLRVDAAKAVHGYNSSALESDQSRIHLKSSRAHDCNLEIEAERLEKNDSTNHIEIEFHSLSSEVELLGSAIEIAETKFQEERIQNTVKIRNANKLIAELIDTRASNRSCYVTSQSHP
jgi:hypothetical protein